MLQCCSEGSVRVQNRVAQMKCEGTIDDMKKALEKGMA